MENARRVVEDVIRTDVPDGVSFTITKVSDIMEGHDYPGIRSENADHNMDRTDSR